MVALPEVPGQEGLLGVVVSKLQPGIIVNEVQHVVQDSLARSQQHHTARVVRPTRALIDIIHIMSVLIATSGIRLSLATVSYMTGCHL